jgi:hypothetical protein
VFFGTSCSADAVFHRQTATAVFEQLRPIRIARNNVVAHADLHSILVKTWQKISTWW